jgi:hypothetical protein
MYFSSSKTTVGAISIAASGQKKVFSRGLYFGHRCYRELQFFYLRDFGYVSKKISKIFISFFPVTFYVTLTNEKIFLQRTVIKK